MVKKQISLSLLAFLLIQVQCYKVLISGDFDQTRSEYFAKLAEYYSTTGGSGKNTYYLLTNTVKPLEIKEKSQNLFLIGLPEQAKEIKWDPSQNEHTNYFTIEKQQISLFFKNQNLLDLLKKQNFDAAVGSLSFSDTLLFRYLGVQYIKVTNEDVESYTMQVKMNMPVMASTYPSIQAYNYFALDQFGQDRTLPIRSSLRYRFQQFVNYQLNRWFKYNRKNEILSLLPENLHHLVTDYDQEHGLFIGEGPRFNGFQSTMPKPPNSIGAFPLIERTHLRGVQLKEGGSFSNADQINLWNVNSRDQRDYFHNNVERVKKLVNAVKQTKVHTVLFLDKTFQQQYPEIFRELKQLSSNNLMIVEENFYEVELKGISSHTKVNVIGTCSLETLLNSYNIYDKVYFSGYYNDLIPTQKYECENLVLEGMGYAYNLHQDQDFHDLLKPVSADHWAKLAPKSHKQDSLLREERDRRTLEYWIEFIVRFGIKEKIPIYDKMGLIQLYSLDLAAGIALFVFVLFETIRYCCCCCCRKKDSKKVKYD